MIQLKPGIPPASLKGPPNQHRAEKAESRKRKTTACVLSAFSAMLTVAPFDQIEWERRTAEITDDSGKVIFKQENIEVPKSWSALATKIAVSKYFYGDIANGTDPHKGGRETSVRQLIHRVTRTIADWGIADGYFADAEAAEVFYDELTWLCVNQHGAFNSPVWFNVGLYHQYGVGKGAGAGQLFLQSRDRQGRTRAPRSTNIRRAAPASSRAWRTRWKTSCAWRRARRCSSSTAAARAPIFLRFGSTREKLSGGGKPSGPLSFLKVYDQVANVVKSGGKTRRAAKMNTLKDWHPRHRGVHRRETEGREKSVGADRAGLRRQLQRRRLRLGHVSERKPERARERRIHGRGAGRPRMVDAPRASTASRANAKMRARCCAKSPKARMSAAIPGCNSIPRSTNGTPAKAPTGRIPRIPCSEYLFLDNTACNLASLNLMKFKTRGRRVRRRALQGGRADFHHRAGNHRR